MNKHPNNFKVAGTKLLSRFGWSHRAEREYARYLGGGPAKPSRITKRAAKKCKHEKWIDTSYGGPEGGDISGYCRTCGYSHHNTLY